MSFAWEEEPTGFERNEMLAVIEIVAGERCFVHLFQIVLAVPSEHSHSNAV